MRLIARSYEPSPTVAQVAADVIDPDSAGLSPRR
jgi:hypothetical protein